MPFRHLSLIESSAGGLRSRQRLFQRADGDAGLEGLPDGLPDGVDGILSAHDDKALGHGFGQKQVALADGVVELNVFLLHAVRKLAGALFGASEADGGGDVDDHGNVRHKVSHGELVDHPDGVVGEVAGDALVNGGRVQVAIAEDEVAGVEGRLDDLTDELGSARGKEEEFGFGADFTGGGVVFQEVSNGLADGSATGFAGDGYVVPEVPKAARQAVDLGGFATAFTPLKGDELSGGPTGYHVDYGHPIGLLGQ